MAQIFTNNANSTLASGITDVATSMTVASGEGAKFPSPSGGDYFLLTLTQGSGAETSWEIVKCTARSTDTLTIVRAQESTTGVAWSSGDKASLRVTKGTMEGLAQLAKANTFTAQQTFVEVKDTVYTITDGAAFEIDPANGSVQIVTLGASRTPAATNFEAGQTVLLGIDDGTAYSVTWTTVAPTWVTPGGTAAAPTLAASGYTWILMTKIGSTIFASEWGQP